MLREQRVMLDADLAELYGVPTTALVHAVKRNATRFAERFHIPALGRGVRGFEITVCDLKLRRRDRAWRAAHGTVRLHRAGRGDVAMLSSVLGSARAIAVNIEIMRTFVRVRALAATHGDLADLDQATAALAMSVRRAAPTHDAA